MVKLSFSLCSALASFVWQKKWLLASNLSCSNNSQFTFCGGPSAAGVIQENLSVEQKTSSNGTAVANLSSSSSLPL